MRTLRGLIEALSRAPTRVLSLTFAAGALSPLKAVYCTVIVRDGPLGSLTRNVPSAPVRAPAMRVVGAPLR